MQSDAHLAKLGELSATIHQNCWQSGFDGFITLYYLLVNTTATPITNVSVALSNISFVIVTFLFAPLFHASTFNFLFFFRRLLQELTSFLRWLQTGNVCKSKEEAALLTWINPLVYFRHLRRVKRSYKTLYDVPIYKFRHAVLGILRRTVWDPCERVTHLMIGKVNKTIWWNPFTNSNICITWY